MTGAGDMRLLVSTVCIDVNNCNILFFHRIVFVEPTQGVGVFALG